MPNPALCSMNKLLKKTKNKSEQLNFFNYQFGAAICKTNLAFKFFFFIIKDWKKKIKQEKNSERYE